MTWDPAPELIREIVDAGADDILLQPTSRNLLKERIDTLTFDRKPFVVSARHIGPDRRCVPGLVPCRCVKYELLDRGDWGCNRLGRRLLDID